MKQEEKGKQTIDTIMREGFPSLQYSGECGLLCTTHEVTYIYIYCIICHFISFTRLFVYIYVHIDIDMVCSIYVEHWNL